MRYKRSAFLAAVLALAVIPAGPGVASEDDDTVPRVAHVTALGQSGSCYPPLAGQGNLGMHGYVNLETGLRQGTWNVCLSLGPLNQGTGVGDLVLDDPQGFRFYRFDITQTVADGWGVDTIFSGTYERYDDPYGSNTPTGDRGIVQGVVQGNCPCGSWAGYGVLTLIPTTE